LKEENLEGRIIKNIKKRLNSDRHSSFLVFVNLTSGHFLGTETKWGMSIGQDGTNGIGLY